MAKPLQNKIDELINECKRKNTRRFLLSAILVFIGCYFIFYILEYINPLNGFLRWFFSFITLLFIVLSYIWFKIIKVKRYAKNIVSHLEDICEDDQQLIGTALEIETKPSAEQNQLQTKVVAQALELLTKRVKRPVDSDKEFRFYLIWISLMFLFVLLISKSHRVAITRFINPISQVAYSKISFIDLPDSFYPNDEILIKVYVSGRKQEAPKLFYNENGEQWVSTEMRKLRSRNFIQSLSNKTKSINVYARSGNVISDTHEIVVVAPPEIDSLNATLHHQKYLKKRVTLQAGGTVIALQGDKMVLSVYLSQYMEKGLLKLPDGREFNMNIEGKTMTAEFLLPDTCVGTYTLSGTATNSLALKPQTFPIEVRPDKLPSVKIIDPAMDLEVTATTEVPIKIFANDDYGLSEIGLSVWIEDKEYEIAKFTMPDSIIIDEQSVANLVLENFPLSINSNIRYYAWATDHNPNRKKRSVSTLRNIDIRPYRLIYKIHDQDTSQDENPANQKMSEGFYKLEDLIQAQRNINSGLFKCSQEGGSTADAQRWRDQVNLALEQTHGINSLLGKSGKVLDDLKIAENEQGKLLNELNTPDWDNSFKHGNKALRHLIKLRQKLITVLSKKKPSSCSCKSSCSSLTELAVDVDEIIEQERSVQTLYNKQITSKNELLSLQTINKQQQTSTNTKELKARLQIHPDGTELNMEQMNKICGLMDENLKLLERQEDPQVNIQNTIQNLEQLAEMLRGMNYKSPKKTLEMAMDMAANTAGLLEKQAKKKETIGRNDKGKPNENPNSRNSARKKDGQKPGQKPGAKPGQNRGEGTLGQAGSFASTINGVSNVNYNSEEGVMVAAKNTFIISDWLNNVSNKTADPEMAQRMSQLIKDFELMKLAEQLKKENGNPARLEALAKQFRQLEKELKREHLNLSMSKLDRLNTIQTKVKELQNQNPEEIKQSGSFSELIKALSISKEDELKNFAEKLRYPQTKAAKGELDQLNSMLDEMISFLLKDEIPSGKDVKVPDKYNGLINKYYKALSDDMDLNQ